MDQYLNAGKALLAYATEIGIEHMDYADFVINANDLINNDWTMSARSIRSLDTEPRDVILQMIYDFTDKENSIIYYETAGFTRLSK